MDLAERLGVSYATVVNLEKGHTAWTEDKIARFSNALGVEVPTVLRGVADAFENGAPAPQESPSVDPRRARLLKLYERRDLPNLMKHLGDLAVAWGLDDG